MESSHAIRPMLHLPRQAVTPIETDSGSAVVDMDARAADVVGASKGAIACLCTRDRVYKTELQLPSSCLAAPRILDLVVPMDVAAKRYSMSKCGLE